MTPFVLLAFVMVALTSAWLTHPLWRPVLAVRRAGGTLQLPRATLVLGAGLALFVAVVAISAMHGSALLSTSAWRPRPAASSPTVRPRHHL
jgi:hypothetical protein